MGRRLYVGGLGDGVEDEGLRELFAAFGRVDFVRVARDSLSGRSEGFGLVEMVTAEEARKAVEALHGSVYEGRTLAVFDGWGPAPGTVVPESPAAVEAREQILGAIGAEARNLEQVPGQASAQLAELARAYAVVTGASTGVSRIKMEEQVHFGHRLDQNTLEGLVQSMTLARYPRSGTAVVVLQADGDGPVGVTVPPESPAAAEARDQLVAAIGAQARSVAEQVPGQVSAQLAELARAYALATLPARVSAWGQSAGASSILNHLIAEGGGRDPLFRSANA
ncbi:hypothetical protein ACFV6G_35990 [Streptomyces lavendulae]|uniref:hypothetical protein n=1 Tax=Streptomyces lavendulae TaxID=1914 RepID=UPI003675FC5C